VDLSSGGRKLQGVSLGQVILSMVPQDRATMVTFYSSDKENTLPLADVLNDDDLRLFTVIESDSISYTFARMDGLVLVENVTRIEVK
jgi:hypothetical protein